MKCEAQHATTSLHKKLSLKHFNHREFAVLRVPLVTITRTLVYKPLFAVAYFETLNLQVSGVKVEDYFIASYQTANINCHWNLFCDFFLGDQLFEQNTFWSWAKFFFKVSFWLSNGKDLYFILFFGGSTES